MKSQRKLEEDRELKRLERVAAERRQKQEVEENKIRRVHLKESCDYFQSERKVWLTSLLSISFQCVPLLYMYIYINK